jgi:hypothetical protein
MLIIHSNNNKRIHSSSPSSPRPANPYFPFNNKKTIFQEEHGSPTKAEYINAQFPEVRKIKTTYNRIARKEKSFENKIEIDNLDALRNERFQKKGFYIF